ncbi:transposase [Lutispora thermophila]|uniref:Transposase DDE domain-containing protein n=1 Tax=Lutispora thermophila DSM 19022 TaxID=1122184 RepID=A0A1M6BWX5_9FIRM|nr:transposase [Lutispora thermophila]SHI53260.1 Transposase DDE domain-containing protein [Lutispora thermophila DSM 19022]
MKQFGLNYLGKSSNKYMENIEKLMFIKGLKFIIKGYSLKKAANITKVVFFDLYEKADDGVYELSKLDSDLRTILVQILGTRSELSYTSLHTNIEESELSAVEAFHFYNGHQTIEAFFKIAKNTYGIKNLRTGSYYGIYSFIWLLYMAHNLISWFKVNKLKRSELYNVGIKNLVEKCSKIKGLVKKTSDGISVIIDPLSKLAKLLLEALSETNNAQLSFLN